MKVSYNWLKQYVDLTGITPEELADRLTSSGLEVEGVEKTAYATKLVIGKMLECKDHPNSDHLHICKVDTGNGVSQIVCGAPNAMEAVGKKVIVALPGCELPGGTIRESKVRGEDSAGMICALFELGVDKKSLSEKQLHGIEILDDDAPLGETNVLGYLGLDDTVLDVSLTLNRADCLAMWSLAKQTGAVLNRPVYLPEEYKSPEELPATATIRIETDKCAWFLGKVVHKVKLGPSPEWIRKALQANGVKSINNLVDISNLVMLETGQPLHYYDLKKIQDREITVKQGLNEVYTALDDIEYKIEPEDIMITNKGRAVGIAGIMGGDDSKIDETTEAILIEAACFDHVCVRNTSLRLNLQTEAAQRFIKMIEPQAGVKAMWRSVELLTKYANAEGIEETVVAGNLIDGVKTISLTRNKVNAVLGTNFTMEEILDPLKRLCFNPRTEGETITVTIPSYRYNDISLPEDVIEDIIQVKGYDNIKGTLPEMPQTIGGLEPMNKMSRTVKKYLKGCGLHEIYSYSLVGQNVLNMGVLPLGEAIPLLNPLSDERKYYRTSLAGSMLENVSYNMAHSASDFGLFETAKVYAEGKEEETRLSVALTGKLIQSAWKKAEVVSDYYAIKGIVYGLLEELGYGKNRVTVKENDVNTTVFHPYQSALVCLDRKVVGIMGTVHPKVRAKYDLASTVLAELNLTAIEKCNPAKLRFTPIPKFPSTGYDLSMLVGKDTPAGEILSVIKKHGTKLLKDAEVFDIYEGTGIAEGVKSVAVRMSFGSEEKTLKDTDMKPIVSGIIDALRKEIGAEIRDR